MAWEDRPHYRDRSGHSANPLRWLVSGSVPVATVFGVRIRAHSSLIVFIAAMLLLDWQDKRYSRCSVRAFSMGVWVADAGGTRTGSLSDGAATGRAGG